MIELARRRMMMGGSPKPYDAEVEYLESTGTQYIDTDVLPSSSIRVRFQALYPISNLTLGFIFGARERQGVKEYALNHSHVSNYRYGTNSGASSWNNTTEDVYTFYNGTNAGNMYVFSSNGDYVTTLYQTVATPSFVCPFPFFLFGLNNGGTPFLPSRCRIYNFTILDNGTEVRDFIPVRKNGIGYMYDKVSGQLFGNQGTGQFFIGPDKTV